jgi:type II secretory pathway pseudopilin PulG
MATVKELEKELAQAQSKGKTNKVEALRAQIRTIKQGQKAARGDKNTFKDIRKDGLNLVDQGQDAQKGLVGSLPPTYDVSQFNNLLPVYDEAAQQTAFDAAYKNATFGLDEQEQRRRAALEQSLADRGIPLGSELYSTQTKDLGTEFEGARTNARNYATSTANAEAERRFGLGKAAYDAAVGNYNMQFDKPIEYGNALAGMNAQNYALAQADREFQENKRQFGETIALEKWKVAQAQAMAAKAGHGGGGGGDSGPIIGGSAPGFQV